MEVWRRCGGGVEEAWRRRGGLKASSDVVQVTDALMVQQLLYEVLYDTPTV